MLIGVPDLAEALELFWLVVLGVALIVQIDSPLLSSFFAIIVCGS